MESKGIGGQTFLVFSLELLNKMIDELSVEILTTWVVVTSIGLDLKDTLVNGQEGDIKGPSVKIEDENVAFTNGLLIETMSRTQISTQDVTQLCHEICDIKKGPINNQSPDDLSKISSNTPGQWDIRDKGAPGYAESVCNKLCHAPPSDTLLPPKLFPPVLMAVHCPRFQICLL